MTQTIRLNAVRIDVTPDLVTTTLPDGEVVYGAPHDTPEYAAHAAERGYGDDVARANRCHEVGHSLLAYWLGLKCSPTLLRVGRGQMAATEVTGLEEACLLSLERFANAMGVDLEQVAMKLSSQFTGNNDWRIALHEQGTLPLCMSSAARKRLCSGRWRVLARLRSVCIGSGMRG